MRIFCIVGAYKPMGHILFDNIFFVVLGLREWKQCAYIIGHVYNDITNANHVS